MKKLTLAGCLTVFSLFLPSRCPAVPIDVSYATLITTTSATGTIVVSSTNFPNANTSVNTGIANYQWCITHVYVQGGAVNNTFTMAWSTAPFTQALTSGTTDYKVTFSSTPYEMVWPYRQPYCSPLGQTVLTLTSTVSNALMEIEGYLFRGWNQ